MTNAPRKVVELDVRAQLKNNEEPFQLIMNAVRSLKAEEIFVLHATFKPTPLLAVMRTKGYENDVEQLDNEHWMVTFKRKEG